MSKDTLKVDAPEVTRDEALELMVHHLQLAAMYFEAVRDTPKTRVEVSRLLDRDARSRAAALAWYDTIYQYYEALKEGDR